MRIVWSFRTSGSFTLTGSGAMSPGRIVAIGVRDAAWSTPGNGRMAPDKGPFTLPNIGTDLDIKKYDTIKYTCFHSCYSSRLQQIFDMK